MSIKPSLRYGSPLVRSTAGIENQGNVLQYKPSMGAGMSAVSPNVVAPAEQFMF